MKLNIIPVLSIASLIYVLSTTVIFTILTKDDEESQQLSSSLESFQGKFIHNTKPYEFIKSKPDIIIHQSEKQISNESHMDKELPLFPTEYFGSSTLSTNKDDEEHEFQPAGPLAFQEYIHGTSPYQLSATILAISDDLANERKHSVKAAMKHIWKHYSSSDIIGSDEIRPVSNTGKNMDGIARTLVDSLDTLWIMDLKEEFYQARDYVRDKLTHNVTRDGTSVFETNIRSLGGLLSAYDWSRDKTFLEKAIELGNLLLKAFDTPSGLPYPLIQLSTGKCKNSWQGKGKTNIAEAGSFIIEFRYLSKVSGNPIYGEKAEIAMNKILKIKPNNGLFKPVIQNLGEDIMPKTSPSYATYSFGAYSDSFYEYMLKGWLQTGQIDKNLLDSYNAAIEGMYKHLFRKSSQNGFSFISDARATNINSSKVNMEHLTCFMGGLLGLGAHFMSQLNDSYENKERIERDMQTAKAITYTCYQMYASTNTGLGSEEVIFVEEKGNLRGSQSSNAFEMQSSKKKYILRPEVVESLYIMHTLTRDPIYREWGWEIFQAIEKNCKTLYGYGAYTDVTKVGDHANDEMESFFPAETLKYLYLLFDPDSKVDLDTYVFNTEAHPLKMFDKM